MPDDLGIAERLRRKMGRPARTQSVATRFTTDEELELLKAAERQGQTLREWTREAMLREARRPPDDPTFTEVIALRVVLHNMLKSLLTGQMMTEEGFERLVQDLRKEKRQIAREVMATYAPESQAPEP